MFQFNFNNEKRTTCPICHHLFWCAIATLWKQMCNFKLVWILHVIPFTSSFSCNVLHKKTDKCLFRWSIILTWVKITVMDTTRLYHHHSYFNIISASIDAHKQRINCILSLHKVLEGSKFEVEFLIQIKNITIDNDS